MVTKKLGNDAHYTLMAFQEMCRRKSKTEEKERTPELIEFIEEEDILPQTQSHTVPPSRQKIAFCTGFARVVDTSQADDPSDKGKRSTSDKSSRKRDRRKQPKTKSDPRTHSSGSHALEGNITPDAAAEIVSKPPTSKKKPRPRNISENASLGCCPVPWNEFPPLPPTGPIPPTPTGVKPWEPKGRGHRRAESSVSKAESNESLVELGNCFRKIG